MLHSLLVVADIHYAGPSETTGGWNEAGFARTTTSKLVVRTFRHFIWRRDPFAHNYLLDHFLERVGGQDSVVGLGDYSCDIGCIGVADARAFESVEVCLRQLRQRCGSRLELVIGDHELGKMSVVGNRGGFRWASLERSRVELNLPIFWRKSLGSYVVMGITSSLVALPVYLVETLPEERAQWWTARAAHLQEIRNAFRGLSPSERVILFCHDPTALPFLFVEPEIRSRLSQIEVTMIGHLHSPLFLKAASLLTGLPRVDFLGSAVRRMSAALNQAKCWRDFRVRVCPALAGIELLKDGGYYQIQLDPEAQRRIKLKFIRLPWKTVGSGRTRKSAANV